MQAKADATLWPALLEIRESVALVMERARKEKLVGSSLDARVMLHVADAAVAAGLQRLQASGTAVDELRYLLIVSEVWGDPYLSKGRGH